MFNMTNLTKQTLPVPWPEQVVCLRVERRPWTTWFSDCHPGRRRSNRETDALAQRVWLFALGTLDITWLARI